MKNQNQHLFLENKCSDFDNKINQFHHIHICINLKKSAQDIRNKKSTILLTPLNLNLGLHSNLTRYNRKENKMERL